MKKIKLAFATSKADLTRRINGTVQGRQNVITGHMQRLASIGGTIAGITNAVNGVLVERARISGQVAVKSGRLAKLRTPEHQAKAGRVQGLINAKNGLFYKNAHVRWHVKRGIVKAECTLCMSEAR